MPETSLTSNGNIYRVDEPFPKIDNLEWFPEKVLLNIFAAVDFMDLCHLSQISNRFEKITQGVFIERYGNNYFNFVGEKAKDKAQNLFRCFGSHITGIHIKKLKQLDENHWIIQLMNEHTKRLSKCRFSDCEFNDVQNALSQQLNITELRLERNSIADGQQLPEFRHLKIFEVVGNHFPKSEYNRVILNNRQLERLKLFIGNVEYDVLAHVGPHLTDLNLLDLNHSLQELIPISTDMEQRLEKLLLSIDDLSVDALEHISLKCKNIKELTIFIFRFFLTDDLVDAIRTFTSITSLDIRQNELDSESVQSIVGGLPNLINLHIGCVKFPPTNEYLLDLLSSCESLETISIDVLVEGTKIYNGDIDGEFHEKFLDIVRNRSNRVNIRLLEMGKIVTTITKEKINHRNKLFYWIGWRLEDRRSTINFSDLMKTDSTSDKRKRKQEPIELILEYMDVNSLYAFRDATPECKRLVDNHMKKRYQEEGKMFIATEHGTKLEAIQTFGQYVTNLNVTVYYHYHNSPFWTAINDHCRLVTTLKVLQFHMLYSTNSITNALFYFPCVKNFEYTADALNAVDFDILRMIFHRHLTSLKFTSNIKFNTNFSRYREFANLVDIEFHTRNNSIDDFLNSLDGSIQRNISFKN